MEEQESACIPLKLLAQRQALVYFEYKCHILDVCIDERSQPLFIARAT